MFESDLADLLQTLDPSEPVPWMVDKDYWLTRVLRRLASEMPGEFLFKGGTSLSMGYGLIERFSEDIDLLVTSDTHGKTIDDILSLAEEELGERVEIVREGAAYRFAIVKFRHTFAAPASQRNMRTIRIDVGAQGGGHPSEERRIEPLAKGLVVARGLPADYPDLEPFEIEVLHPARTCLEKLEAVHAKSLKLGTGDPLTSRDGKHPYDIYQILDHQPSFEVLNDANERDSILDAIDEANRMWFGGPSTRPSGGYADSPAFVDPEVSSMFSAATDGAMSSYLWPNAVAPKWKDITDRISANAHLL